MLQRAFHTVLDGAAWAVLCAAAPAHGSPAPDKGGFTLFNPTPRELMREMSTDRPDTTESAYTVDAGHFQVEMSLVDYGHDSDDGVTTRTWGVAPMLLKVGLLNAVDLQLGLDPHTDTRTTDGAGGEEVARGIGDTTVRVKINLWGNDGGTTALSVMPFVTFPTAADDLGASRIEGGVIVPLAVELPAEFGLGVMAEFDFARNRADDRYVVDFLHTVTVGRDLVGDLAAYIEYAGFYNLNADEDYRAYFDAGLTYGLTPDVQLDAGFRAGLTDAADDLGLFAGVSWRH